MLAAARAAAAVPTQSHRDSGCRLTPGRREVDHLYTTSGAQQQVLVVCSGTRDCCPTMGPKLASSPARTVRPKKEPPVVGGARRLWIVQEEKSNCTPGRLKITENQQSQTSGTSKLQWRSRDPLSPPRAPRHRHGKRAGGGDRRKAAPTVGSRRRIPGAGAALASPTRSDRFMGKGRRKLWQPSPHVPVPCGLSVDL
jgi:hypothetical protein